MGPAREPWQRSGSSAGRIIAAGAAASVTLLTLAGMLGFGPGAAHSPSARSAPSSDAAADLSKRPAPDDPADLAGSDDGWLSYDDGPPPAKSPPALPSHTGTGKRVVYDISDQRVWLVSDKNRVARTYLVSGGKDPTLLDPGRYAVYSKSRHAVSYNHRETMGYMVRFASGENAPIGFHDIPLNGRGERVQDKSDLGTPLSSGCIRQWPGDARAMWQFADLDTPVVVTA